MMGEYLDGLAWEPPENYDPTRRDWYLAAIEAKGETTLVSPYVDAQTDAVIISISRMLSSGVDVISIDVLMDRIQEIASGLQIKGKGYGFIINREGMLIAHRDDEKKGTYLTDDESQLGLVDQILEVENGSFEVSIKKQKNMAFVRQIADDWYAVIVISNREIFSEVWQQLFINVVICGVIFTLIALFYVIGSRNEQNYSRRIEQMRVEEQKQAYEAKSDFLASMSHEIRTPINAVLGMNELILRETAQVQQDWPPERQMRSFANIRSCAGNIENAGSSLLSIINDVLDFSKIEAGRMEITETEYSLSSVLNDVCNLVLFRAREKGVEFNVDADETIPDGLYGDEVHVRQIITNLLTNAVKYTDRGSIRLHVRSEGEERKPGAKLTLVISVKDTGIGIHEEDIDKLFGKFQRVDLEKTSTVEGTGLGLAITHRLLTMMGGEIRLESVYGEGSEFTAYIPQKIASCDTSVDFQKRFKENMLDAGPYRAAFRAPDAHILIVDDTRVNLTVAVGLLERTRIRIDTALSGEEALKAAAENAYDIILMDQRMPIMDGTQTLHRIREQEGGRNRNTPVICLTADAVKGAKERYLADGFTDYLTKPIDSKALEEMLKQYLPEDKVLPDTEGSAGAEEWSKIPGAEGTGRAEAGFSYDSLRQAGILPEEGLRWCQGDEELYATLLGEYRQSAEERIPELKKYYDAGNWKDYGVLVHAVKSSSRMIGAGSLSALAADLEEAADREDADAVRKNHGEMMRQYQALSDALPVREEASF